LLIPITAAPLLNPTLARFFLAASFFCHYIFLPSHLPIRRAARNLFCARSFFPRAADFGYNNRIGFDGCVVEAVPWTNVAATKLRRPLIARVARYCVLARGFSAG
jgi:hypothetical protein